MVVVVAVVDATAVADVAVADTVVGAGAVDAV